MQKAQHIEQAQLDKFIIMEITHYLQNHLNMRVENNQHIALKVGQ